MECRNSGLSDRQWCIENTFPMSTMYIWINKLRNNACPDIPENPNKYCSFLSTLVPLHPPKTIPPLDLKWVVMLNPVCNLKQT